MEIFTFTNRICTNEPQNRLNTLLIHFLMFCVYIYLCEELVHEAPRVHTHLNLLRIIIITLGLKWKISYTLTSYYLYIQCQGLFHPRSVGQGQVRTLLEVQSCFSSHDTRSGWPRKLTENCYFMKFSFSCSIKCFTLLMHNINVSSFQFELVYDYFKYCQTVMNMKTVLAESIDLKATNPCFFL